ncbi:hypothetical protein L0668_13210 [Paraglaciecola aquimarina]|uniref:Uncharacterized protein n=1 Tax=Paraglaciecola algarum TaxID=3050085 RepID=A0ABS9DBA0_9ALTE|nr:hypothetical protein [Paraglaciecola sp. G1-23]MCF2949074.1 hypothetical protein [Paraglaciecola sp. G1-23]
MSQDILNKLSLKPVGHYRGLGLIFDVYIDDVCLLDSIAEFEKRFDHKINGAYTAGLGSYEIMHSMATINNQGQRFRPYVCDCGEWECWVLQGLITGFNDFVFWGQWRNPNRDDVDKKSQGLYWNYADFPILCFDKQQYLTEVEKAQDLVRADKESIKLLKLFS